MEVNEAWRNDKASGVHDSIEIGQREISAHSSDPVADNRDVRPDA
jgi:hypothetical protein